MQQPGEEGPQDIESSQVMTGVQPFVHDTRNLLLFKVDAASFKQRSEDFLASISYALQRGMQVWFPDVAILRCLMRFFSEVVGQRRTFSPYRFEAFLRTVRLFVSQLPTRPGIPEARETNCSTGR